jgi:hypothetical protein
MSTGISSAVAEHAAAPPEHGTRRGSPGREEVLMRYSTTFNPD